jgi:hypothetical protein
MPAPTISRHDAFTAQGVTLRYPQRSWSGVRADDGAVVIALREAEIQSHFEGFSCLLWAPVIEGATEWVDRPSKRERLEHCRLAVLRSGAEGLIAYGPAAQIERDAVLTLRVEIRSGEYWALWGSRAFAPGLAPWRSARAESFGSLALAA